MDVIPNSRLSQSIINHDPAIENGIVQGVLSNADARILARTAAHLLGDHYRRSGELQIAAVDILFMLATSTHPHLAAAGTDGLFTLLAERLSDAFDPAACRLYDLIFSRIIDASRHHPSSRTIDQALRRFGLKNADDLMVRKQRVIERQPAKVGTAGDCRKCIVLSRVSLGAEIAVTSPVIAKLGEMFPRAEIVLIGHRIFGDLFSGVPRFRIRHCSYPPGNTLLARLEGWLDVLGIVDEEIAGLTDTQYLIVDPDSRLTQLGLLPLVQNESRYLFFESRSFRCRGFENISTLTSCWLQHHFGGFSPRPFVQPPIAACRYAQALRSRLIPADHTLTAVSLGVGGNDKKRLGIAFERALLDALACIGHNTVLLFKGIGREESERSERILASLSRAGKIRIAEIQGDDPRQLVDSRSKRDLLTWQGSLATYCALIAQSDIQIGYDSSNQHIATAAGVATIGIFADATTPMFVKRWAPHGTGPVRTVQAYDAAGSDLSLNIEDLDTRNRSRIETCLSQVLSFFSELTAAKNHRSGN